VQDAGRDGWAAYGIPPSGAMDAHAAGWANRLIENTQQSPVLELLIQGAEFELLADTWIAITGADATCNQPLWRAVIMRRGEHLEFPRSRRGLWVYVAVAGGWQSPRWLGSSSVCARAGIGQPLAADDLLCRPEAVQRIWPSWRGGRRLASVAQRDYAAPPALAVWPGPQWDLFSPADRARFFDNAWSISARSDRVGYRLEGEPLAGVQTEILSEPVLTGSVQVPPGGLPIVTMRDGPTVGGYPKLGLLDPPDVSWLAQCRPGTVVRFVPVHTELPLEFSAAEAR